jgi:hypothetical protein
MKIRVNVGVSAALGLMLAAGLAYQARGQYGIVAPGPDGNLAQTPVGFLPMTPPAPRGEWGEIITATPKWLVVQNEQGQQFPIAADSIRQFLIRWPSSTAALTPQSMVEVNGLGMPNDSIYAEHLDVYEDSARTLVSPTVLGSHGFRRDIQGYEVDMLNTNGITNFWTPQEWMTPNRMHVVGNPVANDPVRLAVFGSNPITVLTNVDGLTVTQITQGSNSYAKRGDLVYVESEGAETRGLDVTRLVLYKKMPIHQFTP